MSRNLQDAVVQDLHAMHAAAVERAGSTARDFTEAMEKYGSTHAIVNHGEALVASQRACELWGAFMTRWSDAPESELERRLVEAVRATLLGAFPEPAQDGWFQAAVGDARGRETNRFRKQIQDVHRRLHAEAGS